VWRHRAQRVATPGQFDLEDLGAEVAQQRGGKRAGDDIGDVEDSQPGERAGALRASPDFSQ
jgi:hypothetical protein